MNLRRLLFAVRVVVSIGFLGVVAGATSGASASSPQFDSFHVVPSDGASWQSSAGLPDSNGNASVGMVQTVSQGGHTDVAAIKGVDSMPASLLHSIGFAVGPLPSGIDPCWLVGITNADGITTSIHVVTIDENRPITHSRIGETGFTQWTWTPGFTDGIVASVQIGVMAQSGLPLSDVTFDNFTVNGVTADKGGQATG